MGTSPEDQDDRLLAQRIDLSFLGIPSTNQSEYGLYESQISVVICGSDHSRYIVYAFDDTEVNEDFGDKVSSLGGIMEDPLFRNNDNNVVLDASFPIWDPREYFLTVFNSRADQVSKKWEDLILRIEHSIKRDIDVCLYFILRSIISLRLLITTLENSAPL